MRLPAFRIDPGVGAGGSVLFTGEPWAGSDLADAAAPLSPPEREMTHAEEILSLLVTPLRGERGMEGVVYVGSRGADPPSPDVIAQAVQVGERFARPIRDAYRLQQAIRRWHMAGTEEEADALHLGALDRLAHLIAGDARMLLRSGIGIVFLLDRISGALHSVGVEGMDVPEVRRGQVLPPGCGSAGRAVASRKVFVTGDYTSGVEVPPIMAEALPAWAPFATLSAPFIDGDEVIGALTVARPADRPYDADDERLGEQMASAGAPILSRLQHDGESALRERGAVELSRLAGSLTQSLNVTAVCERLAQGAIALVNGVDAAVWDARGRRLLTSRVPGVLRESEIPRLQTVLDRVQAERRTFWTTDINNDPRLAEQGASIGADGLNDRAVLAAPVRIRDDLLAIAAVSALTGHVFSEADAELLQGLADLAALAMANAQAYQELKVSRAAMLQHEKLVAVGRLAAGLAHEIRNPLQNAVSSIGELRERATSPALTGHPEFTDFPSFLKLAHEELRRAASIVGRLLDFVRERRPSFDLVDVAQTIREAIALVEPATRSGTKQVSFSGADARLRVRADAVMLKQVIVNLLTNALDALERSGQVHVRLEHRKGARRPVVVTIDDTGKGIRPEQLPLVFDLFYTTKEPG
jgi:signal transduction histidine kinase